MTGPIGGRRELREDLVVVERGHAGAAASRRDEVGGPLAGGVEQIGARAELEQRAHAAEVAERGGRVQRRAPVRARRSPVPRHLTKVHQMRQ